MPQNLPTGTVTFFFSDLEGSTKLVQDLGDRWPALLERHDAIVRSAIEDNDGVEVRTIGDAFFVAFPVASQGVSAAAAVQRLMADEDWPDDRQIRVRVGLHTGIGALGGSDYVGLDVHRAARIADAAHGGQVVMSEATAALVEDGLEDGWRLHDLGKHRLKDLLEKEALFELLIPGLSREFPPLRTLDAVPNNLPVQVTSFVGREDDLRTALDLLQTNRILTLLGPGGTGKSRLSIQVAAEAAEDFGDGVFFIPLAPVTDGDLIPPTILSVLGVRVASGGMDPREQLLKFLEDKSLLIVLDNFEQLVESAAIVSDMAAASPGSKFLVSSRIPLRVRGEQELSIPPLEVASADAPVESLIGNEAVHLFVERAQSVDPSFELTAENAQAVVDLVARLDGLPLAIELIVPRLKVLSVDAILDRLDMSDLTSGARDAPERHRTMWNAIRWSEESLPEACRRLFRRLSVFVGGARLEEIEAVCGPVDELGIDVLDGIAVLVDSSLVLREDGRFRMLQVIREFASAMLEESDEGDEIRHRHALAFCSRIEEAFPEFTRADRKAWLEAIDADHDNLRAAIAHCVALGHTDSALRFAWSMWRYWQARGYLYEARRMVEEILAMDGGDPMRRAKAVEALGGIAWWQGDVDGCVAAYEEAFERQTELGDPREIANARYNLGLAHAFFREDHQRGEELLSAARAEFEALEDAEGVANAEWGLGNLEMYAREDFPAALVHYEASADGYRRAGNVFGEGWAEFELGDAHRRVGDPVTARPHLEKGLKILYGTGDVSAAVLFVFNFAGLAADAGDAVLAHRLAGAAYGAADRSGIDLISVSSGQIEGLDRETLEKATGDLGAAFQEGYAMSYDEAVAHAMETEPNAG
ncbi:MAG TPA: adenylate/guanylate cyclase domain-containing protein [Acidimicrobiia bacterium]|nr:adenylate/guanylate cyclase domain-containing protein [Acidimicrobiia bacterium]